MPKQLNFYMDDSGSRRPNHVPLLMSPGKRDFFALGGILVDEDDETHARNLVSQFKTCWGIDYPLHSVEIRNATGNFTWLRRGEHRYEQFMSAIADLLVSLPVLGLACVIDRPGYDARYRERYGRRQWHLCQTAFSIAVERAAKEAIARGSRLNVYVERCSEKDDKRLRNYWVSLRETGHPFDPGSAETYAPLTDAELSTTLYDLKFKRKSSPLVQIADLYLWPLGQGGYRENYRPYRLLREKQKIVDCLLTSTEKMSRGCKYSCFPSIEAASA